MRSSTWVVAGKRAAYLGSGWQACCIHRLGVMGRAGALWQQAAQPRPSVAALGGTHRTWDSHTGPALGGTQRTWDSHTGPALAGTHRTWDSHTGPALRGTHRTWDSHTGPALGGTHRTWDSHTGPALAGTHRTWDSHTGPALGGTHRTWDSHTGPALGGTHRTWDSHTGPVCARWAQLPAVVSPTHVVVHSGRQQQRHSSHWVAAAAALPLGGSSSSEAPLQHALHTATTCPFMVSCIAAHNLSCETFSVKSSIGQAEHSSVSAPVQEYRCLLTEYYSVR